MDRKEAIVSERRVTMRISFALMFLFLLAAGAANAQQDKSFSDIIETSVAKLQQKVLLSSEQASEVKSLLTGSEKQLRNNTSLNELKTKVESLLDDRQKAKYSIIQEDWWNNLLRDIGQTGR